MPSDLTPEEREAALEAIGEGIFATDDGWVADLQVILDALLAAGWRPAPHPDAISAAEARGRREGIEAAAKEVEACAAILDHPSVYMGGPSRRARRVAAEFSAVVRALSSIPPQEADPT